MNKSATQAKKFRKYWTNGTNKKIYKYINLQSQRDYLTDLTYMIEAGGSEATHEYRWDSRLNDAVLVQSGCEVLSIPEVQELLNKYGFSVIETNELRFVRLWVDEEVETFKFEKRYKFGIFPYTVRVPAKEMKCQVKPVEVLDTAYKVTFTGVPTKITKKSKTKRLRK